MKLFASLYLDEDVSILVVKLLRSRGLEVTTVLEQQMLQCSDKEQLAFAVAHGHALLTHNRLDFEALHTQYLIDGHQHAGIIIATRRNPYDIVRLVAALTDTLTADEIANQLLYV